LTIIFHHTKYQKIRKIFFKTYFTLKKTEPKAKQENRHSKKKPEEKGIIIIQSIGHETEFNLIILGKQLVQLH
jgi:hypothetical protein